MLTISLIGYGKLGSHLSSAFLNAKKVKLVQVYNRTLERITHLQSQCEITDNINQLKPVDVYIISVSDHAIANVAEQLKTASQLKDPFVVHTSGATPMAVLQHFGRKGVFYPLQSFSREQVMDFSTVPFCLEAQTDADLVILEQLANAISSPAYRINSAQRKALHVSAVFANNFSNHMFTIAEQICSEYDVPFEILHPIILETAQKIQTLSPANAQTGPASRGDNATMESHLALLTPEQQAIYQHLSESIKKHRES